MTIGRRLRVTINGRPHMVEVENPAASQTTVTVDGKPYQVSIDTEPPVVMPVGNAGDAPKAIARQAPAAAGPAGPLTAQVKAPMPGKVLDIAVKPGERVSFGLRLCALEAMKMNNAIRSPRDGVIATVEVTEGQVVSHGDLLFTFQ